MLTFIKKVSLNYKWINCCRSLLVQNTWQIKIYLFIIASWININCSVIFHHRHHFSILKTAKCIFIFLCQVLFNMFIFSIPVLLFYRDMLIYILLHKQIRSGNATVDKDCKCYSILLPEQKVARDMVHEKPIYCLYKITKFQRN